MAAAQPASYAGYAYMPGGQPMAVPTVGPVATAPGQPVGEWGQGEVTL